MPTPPDSAIQLDFLYEKAKSVVLYDEDCAIIRYFAFYVLYLLRRRPTG